jgi:L-ascorbate metabolism protein UlaG (beta-lactamase superfamily)
MKRALILVLILSIWAVPLYAGDELQMDVVETEIGDLEITFIGHGTLMMAFDEKIIHIDPFSRVADYAELPDADLILITHHHGDHLDLEALKHIRTDETVLVVTEKCAEKVEGGIVLKNGDVKSIQGLIIEAVPAYNLVQKRDDGQFYHPKGEGNGYVVTFAEKRIYIAGDTENTPEMKSLKGIDIAFLPMNLPYTMTPEMVADAAVSFKPKVLYPYHYGKTDPAAIVALLKDHDEISVRIREMP